MQLLALLAAASGALLGPMARHRPPQAMARAIGLRAAEPATAGAYGVGAGDWGAMPSHPAQGPKTSGGRRGSGRRGGKRGGGPRGRGRGTQNPVLFNVLRKMKGMEDTASLDDVDAVLGARRMTARDYTTVLTALKQRNAWQLALRVGEWLHRRAAGATEHPVALPNRAHYQVMLGACAASGAAAEAQELIAQMQSRGVPLDPMMLSTLVLAHERGKQPQRAVELLDELETLLPSPAPAGAAPSVEAVEAPSAEAEAEAEAQATREVTAREQAVASAVDKFFATEDARRPRAPPPAPAPSQPDSAAAVAMSKPTTLPPTSAVDPLAFAYASAIRALDASGDWKGALKIFDRMAVRGTHADAHCYSAALGACRRGAQSRRALSIIAEVQTESRIPANGVMFTLAMAACNAAGDWQQSLQLLEERKSVETAAVDSRGYSVALAACAQGRQWERALELLNEMEAVPGCARNNFAWNNAMVACNKAEQPRQALELYERMRAGECPLSEHSVAAALVACRTVGPMDTSDWQRGQAIFDGSSFALQSSMCVATLLDVLADAEQWTLLLSYFDRVKAQGQLTERAYERAIEACDRVDPERSLILYEELKASGV